MTPLTFNLIHSVNQSNWKTGKFRNRQLPKHAQHHRKQLRGTVYAKKKITNIKNK